MGATEQAHNAEQRWSWDQVTWGSHCGNCIANCTYRVYARDGEIVYQEQSGGIPGFEGMPDMNPLGCQKGGAWHTQAQGDERLLHPLRRVGERGSGQWEQITWDEALDMLADAVIDALETEGPESVLVDPGPESGLVGGMGRARFCNAVGGLSMDSNSTVSDVHLGHWVTFGSLLGGSSADDTFRADTILVWNGNPAYTRIPVLPLPDRGPLPRRQGRADRPRFQPVGATCRHARSAPTRIGPGPVAGDVQRRAHRGPGRPRLRCLPDRPAIPGAHRHPTVPARGGLRGRRPMLIASTSGAGRGHHG